jgi:hypothetical protein
VINPSGENPEGGRRHRWDGQEEGGRRHRWDGQEEGGRGDVVGGTDRRLTSKDVWIVVQHHKAVSP